MAGGRGSRPAEACEGAVDRAALDVDALLAQTDDLLDRALDDAGADADAAALDHALADAQLLLDDRHDYRAR